MKLYLDNCCFNRPFDDQSQLRVRLETEAKLAIQDDIRLGRHQLVWSYVLDYENSRNPYNERREQIAHWRTYAALDIIEEPGVLRRAASLVECGLSRLDGLHVACAITGQCDYFLSTDDGILPKSGRIAEIRIADPITFIKEMSQ